MLSPEKLLGIGLPSVLGLLLSLSIAKEEWFLAFALSVALPLSILFFSRPYLGLYIWLLVIPFISILPKPDLMYWLLHRILIVVTIGIILIKINQLKRSGSVIKLRTMDKAVLFLAGYIPILIFIFQSNPYWPLIRYVDRILVPFSIYLIIRLSPLNEQNFARFEWVVLIIAVSQGLIGIVSVLSPSLLPTALSPYRSGYADGTLDNPNVYAITLIICGLILFQSAMSRKTGWRRYLFLTTCGICVIGVFFSMERAAWLALCLVIFGLFWLYPKPMAIFFLVCGILFLIMQGGALSNFIASASSRFSHQQPIYDRIVVTDAMAQMIMEKPIFGWGYETLNANITNYYRWVGEAFIPRGLVTSHNTFMTIATELGLIVFGLYLLPACWLVIIIFRNWRTIPSKGLWNKHQLIILTLSAMSSFLVSNLMDMRWFPYGIGLWWLTLGLIANIIDPMIQNSPVPSCNQKRHRNYYPLTQKG